jgi:hypothetical protein
MSRKQTQAIIPKQPTALAPPALLEDLRQLITEARRTVAVTVNAGLTLLYGRIGKRVAEEVLGKERAAYGRQIVVSLSRQLVVEHGSSFGEKNLRRMIQFAEVFPEEEIVVSLIRQLSWTHFIALLPLKNSLQRDFYTELCRIEGWSVSTLRRKIDSMLFERTQPYHADRKSWLAKNSMPCGQTTGGPPIWFSAIHTSSTSLNSQTATANAT